MTALESLFTVAAAALVGLLFGSFAAAASHRLPRGESVLAGRSRCPACGRVLDVRDLVPVLSWLLVRGRCRHCAAPIGWRYAAIETAVAILFAVIALRVGPNVESLLLALLAVALVIIAAVDLEHRIIPDPVLAVVLLLAVAYRMLVAGDVVAAALGAFLGLAVGAVLHWGYRYLRHREGLGLGDVKFLAVAGVWLGPVTLIPFLVLAGVLGIAFGSLWRLFAPEPEFPFGPALAGALLFCLLAPSFPRTFWSLMELFPTMGAG